MPSPITFAPRLGAILMCDFGEDPNEPQAPYFRPIGVWPEITKIRRAVVVSPDAFNLRTRRGAGTCIVVPISITPQRPIVPPYHVPLMAARYRALTADGWAKCNIPCTVSHDRLTLPQIGGRPVFGDFVTGHDMALIKAALKAPLGL